MRRLLALIAIAGICVSGFAAPSSAISGLSRTFQYPVAHFDDVPATAISTVQVANGDLKSFYLANGLLYSATRTGNTAPATSIVTLAPQLPSGLSELKTATSSTGAVGVVYTCAADHKTNLCALVDNGDGTFVSPVTLVSEDVLDCDVEWVGAELHVAYTAVDAGLNPFDARRSKIGHAWLSAQGVAVQDDRSSLFVSLTASAFNAFHPAIASRGNEAVIAWESYESAGAVLKYVLRAAVVTSDLATSRAGVVLPGTFSDVTRVRALDVTWLQADAGLVPTVMWVGDLGVFSASESTPGSWVAGSSSAIDAPILMADVYTSDEPALYAVVKTRHVTTPPVTSYQLRDTRTAMNVNVILASAGAVLDLHGYQMPGNNPGVLLCTGSAVTLVDAVTGAVTRTKAITSPCADTQVFDHAGAWVFYGISGTGYSATQNSAHALVWIDNASPLDLSASDGRVIDQKIASLNGVRLLAYVVRDWTDPTTPSLTRERLLYKVITDGSELASGGTLLSDPKMAISSLSWVKTSPTTMALIWQESASTLYATTASTIHAATYDTETRSWSSVATATHGTFDLLSIAQVAQPASGAIAVGGVQIEAGLACSSCLSPPTRGLFFYQPATNTFSLESVAAAQGAPAMDAQAFPQGISGWVFASPATDFQPNVYLRSADGFWSSALPIQDVAIDSSVTPLVVSNAAGNAEAGLGAVVWNEALPGSARGTVTMRRLTHESAGGYKIWNPIVIATNATLVGRPVFDFAGTMWMVVTTGTWATGFQHRVVSITTGDVVTIDEPFNTVDESVRAIPLVDTHGFVAIAVLDHTRARLFQPLNLVDTRWIDLEPTNVSSPFELSAASDEFDFVVAQYKQLTIGRGAHYWTSYPFPDYTPLAVSQTMIGIPVEPGYPGVSFPTPLKRTLTFEKGSADPRVELQWFDLLTGSANAPVTDADGVITLDVTNPGNSIGLRVRWVENRGTFAERFSPWRTVFVDGLQPAPTRTFSGTWTSATSFKVTWTPPETQFPVTYRVELIESGGSVTRSIETSGTSATFTNVKPSASIQYTVRTLQFGAEASAEYQVAAVRVAPSAPRSVVASIDKTALKVAWSAPTTAGSFAISGYKVEMRIGSAAWKTVATTKAGVRTWKLLKPVKGKAYSFRVTALNGLSSSTAASKSFAWKG